MVSRKIIEFNHYVLTHKNELTLKWIKAYNFFNRYLTDSDLEYEINLNGQPTTFRIHFIVNNYAHLMGVKYKHGNKNFWIAVKNNQISWNSISPNHSNYPGVSTPTDNLIRKSQAIGGLADITKPGVKLSLDGSLMKVNFDLTIRSRKEIITILFKKVTTNHSEYYVPISLMTLSNQSDIKEYYQHTKVYDVVHLYKIPFDSSISKTIIF